MQTDFTTFFSLHIYGKKCGSNKESLTCITKLECVHAHEFTVFHISCVTVREDANRDLMISSVIPLIQRVASGASVSAHNTKYKAKSRVLNQWKESFMGSADWCIPLGLEHLLLWRERFDFGVIILTVQLPNIFNCFSVLCEISKVKWCTVLLMAYTVSVLVNSHWFFHLVHNLSRVEKTHAFVLAYVPTWWPWRVACNINDQIVLCWQWHWIRFHCI